MSFSSSVKSKSESKSESELESNSGSGSESDKIGNCIRNVSNFSTIKSFNLIDKDDFNPEMLDLYLEEASPKLKILFEKIQELDKNDMKTHKKLFKHMIFTDVKNSKYGAKIISSAFVAKGFKSAIHPQGTGFSILNNETLLETKSNNFGTLISKTYYNRPMNIKIRKNMLDLYNSRPDNIQGDLLRFIILDQGFKEGIDLFDVKYIHLFEPLTVNADEKQAIGRGTRFCGQKGLEFHPRFGWSLYVFKYDLNIPEIVQSEFSNMKQLFELYLKYSNLDLKKIIFASELEKKTIESSVDFNLNNNIHTFSIENPPSIFSNKSLSGGTKSPITLLLDSKSMPPSRKMNLVEMHNYINTNFNSFKYPKIKLENNCGTGGSLTGNIVSFTNTQDFVRHYFRPSSAYKGILLHHSVGTGKTCTAIATATSSFDKEGYNILWVTRHTLKNDIWKNMYNQVCSIDIQEKIMNGLKLPQKINSPTKYISKNWIKPISYKQFSNMLLKKNNIYKEIIKINGEEDPLRKTLLIIDEAHKLYSPTVAKNEQPNTDILESMIQNSYEKSGDNSVRVILMTATPFTEDGMEMIKLLNLLRTKEEFFPINFNDFGSKYLDDTGYFTASGTIEFQNDISGYISYLNRSQDGRNFAHPVIENIFVPMSLKKDKVKNENKNRLLIKKIKIDMKKNIADCIQTTIENTNIELEKTDNIKKEADIKCNELLIEKEKTKCLKNANNVFKQNNKIINDNKKVELEKCKDIKKNGTLNVKETKKIIDDNKAMMKKYKTKLKEITENNKLEKAQLKEDKEKLNKIIKQIKQIKDKTEKNKKLKEFKSTNPLFKNIKDLIKITNNFKTEISKYKLLIKTIKIKEGSGYLGDISQQTALHKRCKL